MTNKSEPEYNNFIDKIKEIQSISNNEIENKYTNTDNKYIVLYSQIFIYRNYNFKMEIRYRWKTQSKYLILIDCENIKSLMDHLYEHNVYFAMPFQLSTDAFWELIDKAHHDIDLFMDDATNYIEEIIQDSKQIKNQIQSKKKDIESNR
jgi:hypothetical protein